MIAFDDGTIDAGLVGTPWRQRADKRGVVNPDGVVSFAEAQRRKELYLAELRQLDFEQKSGRLVDAETVQRLAFASARDDRDALVNWTARVAPLIAAEVDADQMKVAVSLEKHVRQFLAERSNAELRRSS